MSLSDDLPIPYPASERTLDQHLLWLDVMALERDLAMARLELAKQDPVDRLAALWYAFIGAEDENQARMMWFMAQAMISRRLQQDEHAPFPVDIERKKQIQSATRTNQHILSQQRRRMAAPAFITEQYTGEIND